MRRTLLATTFLLAATPAWSFGFPAHVEGLWADAKRAGISRATFDRATKGLTANEKLRRLTAKQPEFSSPVGTYFDKRMSKQRIAGGRKKVRQYRKLLDRIEGRTGVDPYIVAAIWGLETSYGGYIGKQDVFRSLATLTYFGYRADFFREQFVHALTMLERDGIDRADMRGSWAGAVGQTQFIPSSYLEHAVDFDGDGDRDLWRSVPDALGSAANYLKNNGWQADRPWGYPVSVPEREIDAVTRPWADWAKRGVKRRDGEAFPKDGEATLFFPAGSQGPAFLITENFDVIKSYNQSDAYALVVAMLADRLRGMKPVSLNWPGTPQLPKSKRERLQALMAERGIAVDNRIGRMTPTMRRLVRDLQKEFGLVPDGHGDQELLAKLGG